MMKQPLGLVCAVMVLAGGAYGCKSDAPAGPPERNLGLPAPPPEFDGLVSTWAHACQPGFAGDPSAPEFDPNQPGPHGLVFIAQDGSSHPLNGVIPESWRPRDAQSVQFVACTDDVVANTIESCDYRGTGSATVRRIVKLLSIRVISTHSGAVDGFGSGGSTPDACPPYYTTEPHDLVGSMPNPSDVTDGVVDRYVPIPTCGGTRPYASCLHCYHDASEAAPGGCGPFTSLTEPIIKLRTGQSATLNWEWKSEYAPTFMTSYDPLYLPSVDYFWSKSKDAALLDTQQGPTVVATPTAAGVYSFVAQARLPATDSGSTVQELNFEVDAIDRPVVTDVLSEPDPVILRLSIGKSFRYQVAGRPDGGIPGESLRWAWTEKPPGSAIGDPSVLGPMYDAQWTMAPDVAGEYRIQLEYNDGLGFSAPLVSPPITVITQPLLGPVMDQTAMVGQMLSLFVPATYEDGATNFHWTLSTKPAGSLLDITDEVRPDGYALLFTPDVAGVYVLDVTAVDASGSSAPGHMTITAQ